MAIKIPGVRNVLLLDPGGDGLEILDSALRRCLGRHGVIHRVASLDEFLVSLRSEFVYHLAVMHLERGDGKIKGTEILKRLRRADPDVPVIAVASRGDVRSARRAVAAGATDFLVIGTDLNTRVETAIAKVAGLARVLEHRQVLLEEKRERHDAERERQRILGESRQIRRLVGQIHRVASVPRPVLIHGERGTGKELVARAIHHEGGPSDRPFVIVNCAAFPDTLLESELFGYERGAFTGADSMRQGRFEQAGEGTLFLDEIGSMSIPFQKKILRTVEYGTFNRVGGSEEIHSSARIIAATNVDLAEKMGNGEFLPDLYDRLAFEVISVPPLREREGDIELLAREFLSRFMAEIPGFQGKTLSRSALQSLREYDFPGNVRELKNIIERAAYRDTTNEITPEDIDLPRMTRGRRGGTFTEQVEGFKEALILEALEQAGGNQAEAARRLGISYHQFRHYHRKVIAASRA